MLCIYIFFFNLQGDREGKKRDAGRFFFQFPFSHEIKSEKNEFLPTKMSKISDFL